MHNKVIARYPFYLIANKPFMKIGKIQAGVYWGAPDDYGTGPSFKVGDTLIEPTYTVLEDTYSPDYFIEHYKTITDVVLGYGAFNGETYTIDLSKQEIIFYDDVGNYTEFIGNKVYLLRDNFFLPFVKSKIFETEVMLQIDIGDEVTVLDAELLSGLKPIGEHSLYIYENDEKKTNFPLYEVPIRLSHSVTIKVKARPMSKPEESNHIALGTHGCIGVDLIRNHAVMFRSGEYDSRIKSFLM